ncbi:prepilin-type N-terminal cleavage/methylation domain-containing protein [Arsenophonus apicola]|uniref:Prepilin-type N-terminal cleavage/methylation domain-containing protein n=1 Tax=Arsenophonus apicola TaxID=2879119 RepID=A0ABY8P3D3_9GAMM|nr:prepilin-type N-terminal cleavage/methylation domain-containing protein [Arsenophonus apicola]WGO84010.1 prepilin-type N-terminal cleavage/methylation domain-containing protein [Arsenophonus apicola]
MRQQGFTVLEIIIAIAITALIAVVSIKGWRNYQHKIHLIIVTQKVAAFIARHQMQAAYLNQERQLIIKTDKTSNWMLIVTIKGKKDSQPTTEMKLINSHNEIVLQNYSRVSTLLLGKRGTALPTTLRFSNQSEDILIIISALGRVRLCSHQRLGGIARC